MSKRSCAETPEAKSHFKALHIRALKLAIFGDGIQRRFAALRRKPLEWKIGASARFFTFPPCQALCKLLSAPMFPLCAFSSNDLAAVRSNGSDALFPLLLPVRFVRSSEDLCSLF